MTLDYWQAVTRSYNTIAAAGVSSDSGGDKWVFLCGVWASDAERHMYFWDGSTMGHEVETTSIAPGYTKNRYGIGVWYGTTGGVSEAFSSGYLCRAAFWSVALSADEVNAIARGYSPLKIQPENLISYAPLVREVRNIVPDSLTLTEVGTVPDFHSSPPVQIYSSLPHSL